MTKLTVLRIMMIVDARQARWKLGKRNGLNGTSTPKKSITGCKVSETYTLMVEYLCILYVINAITETSKIRISVKNIL
ncbi:hypothetical protein HanRHA438_Chr11g0495111 [Helianthus annuus]|nr:hypothetical protein HanIR_Chr11g0519031 [Helianthus annuus]KAJ0869983.1 hypothetical protein HanRHA438_Chr11g0495111 [Helianthus annuus]